MNSQESDDFWSPGLSESTRRRKSSIFKRNLKEIDDFWRPGLSRPSRREAGDRKIIDLQRIPFENGKKPMKSKQKRDTFHDSRLKTWKNAIHSTNCNKKTRKTRCFYTTKFHLHRKIAIFEENRWTYRVSWGSRCQTRCKIAILIEKPLFYTVFGSATPEIRDTFIDFRRKSRFYSMLSTAPPQIRDTFIDFLWKSRFYTVFGTATPNLRDTFFDFPPFSRFYGVKLIRPITFCRMYRVFVGRYSNVSRFGANLVGFFLVFKRNPFVNR